MDSGNLKHSRAMIPVARQRLNTGYIDAAIGIGTPELYVSVPLSMLRTWSWPITPPWLRRMDCLADESGEEFLNGHSAGIFKVDCPAAGNGVEPFPANLLSWGNGRGQKCSNLRSHALISF